MSEYNLFGRKIEIVPQKRGTKVCMGCVAAMITGSTLEEFAHWTGDLNPNMRTAESAQALGPWNDSFLDAWILGFGLQRKVGMVGVDICKGYKYPNNPACLIVDSPTRPGENQHIVLWNGEFVFDPIFDKPRHLKDYKDTLLYKGIMEVHPLREYDHFNPVTSSRILGEDLARKAAMRYFNL